MNSLEPDLFSGLAKIMPWPYLLCDRDGTIIYTNSHFERLLELGGAISKGISLKDVFSGDNRSTDVETVLKQLTVEEAWHGKWHFNENGEQLTLELVVQLDPSNEGLLWVIALENPVINNQMVLSTRSELRLLQILMDHTLDYVFFKDIGGRFIITNRAFQSALNVPFPGYEIGKTMSDFVDEQTAITLESTDRDVLDSLKPLINQVELFQLKKGGGRWLQTTKVPVFNQSRKCIGLVCVSRDISEAKENEEKLNHAVAKAEQANQAKSDFLANMSHEIRTPINGILGMTELCLETDISKEQSNYLRSVINCSNTLMALVNDILDFSKIEAGQLELEAIKIDLNKCIEEIADAFMPQTREKGIELVLKLNSNLPSAVMGDPIRIKQILNNLLSNALKFTEEGEIVVSAENIEEKDDWSTIQITVSDTGIGIPADRQNLVFDSFTQADNSTTRKYGGTGLGLAICRQLVELMDGDITVVSEPDRGTSFHVRIKLESLGRSGMLPKEQLKELRGLPVLIIDDNQTNRSILTDLCRNWGFAPQSAASGLEGLEILERSKHGTMPIKLVLLDQQMPSLSGLDVAALITNRPILRDVKMVLLSSSLDQSEIHRAAEIGVTRHLSKPVKQSVLLEVILDVFDLSISAKPTDSSLPFGDSRQPFEQIDENEAIKPMTILMAEDNPVNQEVSLQRLERMGHEVLIVENGRKAVEAYKQARFDLILMDVQMPLMDGFAATRMIRELEQGKDYRTPIIAMTARAMKGDEQRCLDAGMDAYMAKPFRAAKLISILKKVGNVVRSNGDTAEANTPAAKTETGKLHLDEMLADLSQEDKDDLKAAGRVFLEHYEKDLQLLTEYLDEEQWEKLNHQAHSIKGGAGIFEAQRIQTLALSIERAALESNRESVESTLPILKKEVEHLAEELRTFAKE